MDNWFLNFVRVYFLFVFKVAAALFWPKCWLRLGATLKNWVGIAGRQLVPSCADMHSEVSNIIWSDFCKLHQSKQTITCATFVSLHLFVLRRMEHDCLLVGLLENDCLCLYVLCFCFCVLFFASELSDRNKFTVTHKRSICQSTINS